jgi:hypothetical protein
LISPQFRPSCRYNNEARSFAPPIAVLWVELGSEDRPCLALVRVD